MKIHATLEMLDKAVDIIKDIETIRAMEEYGDSEPESHARGRRNYNHYNSYGYSRNDDMMRRMDGMSERDRQRVEDFMRNM